MKLGTVENL